MTISAPTTRRHAGRVRLRHFAGAEVMVRQLGRALRVVQISDQHVGKVTPFAVQREAIEIANGSEPDLVVLTGDYVCHSLEYLDQLEELLKLIAAPTFAVLGNHDHWSGAEEVSAVLRRSGVELLNNANTSIEVGGERLQLVGIDDAYTGHADIEKAVRGLDPRVATLGLSHIGESADEFWARGVPLVLSGHTHGGHVSVGGIHRLLIGALAGHRYVHGLYGCRRGIEAPGAVYVSAGVGAAVFGIRVGERSRREVTAFDLGAPLGSIDEHHSEQKPSRGRPMTESREAKRVAQVERKRHKRDKRQAAKG